MRYHFKREDFPDHPDTRVIAVADTNNRTLTRSYQARYIGNDYALIENDNGEFMSWAFEDMVGAFIPCSALSDKELFLYKISGRLPEHIMKQLPFTPRD